MSDKNIIDASEINASESLQNIKEYFKNNEGKIFTLVTTDVTGEELRYIFKYEDCYYDDVWDCKQIKYKLMYPIDSNAHISYMYSDDMCFEEADYIRLADGYEMKCFKEAYEKYIKYREEVLGSADNRLIEKYNLQNKADLIEFIINKLMKSENITETLKEILDE